MTRRRNLHGSRFISKKGQYIMQPTWQASMLGCIHTTRSVYDPTETNPPTKACAVKLCPDTQTHSACYHDNISLISFTNPFPLLPSSTTPMFRRRGKKTINYFSDEQITALKKEVTCLSTTRGYIFQMCSYYQATAVKIEIPGVLARHIWNTQNCFIQ